MRAGAAALFLLLATGGVAACASIWGFEDGVAADDAGATRPIDDPGIVNAQGATNVVCVPEPPAGWQGPLIIDEAASTDGKLDLKPCPAPYANPSDAFADIADAPDACKCACDPSPLVCTPPVVTAYTGPGCAAGSACATTVTPAFVTSCPIAVNWPPSGCTPGSAKVTTPPAIAPSPGCVSSHAPLAPPQWTKGLRVCSPPNAVPGTCPAKTVPTPVAPIDYENNYCVATPGTESCPSTYPERRILFREVDDKRSCECSCGTPTGACSPPNVVVFDDNTKCSGGPKPLDNAGGCGPVGGTQKAAIYDGGVPTNASCPPQGGPVGKATPTNPLTVCCRKK